MPIFDSFEGDSLPNPPWAGYGSLVAGPVMEHPGVSMTFGVGGAVLQDAPAGDQWSLEMEVSAHNTSMAGIVMLDDTGNGVGVCVYNNPQGLLICAILGYFYENHGAPQSFIVASSDNISYVGRYRLIRRGTEYYAQYSADGGTTWTEENATPFTPAFGFTPTKVGWGDWLAGSQMTITEFGETEGQQPGAHFSAPTNAYLTAPQQIHQGAAEFSAETSAELIPDDYIAPVYGEAEFDAPTFAALIDGGDFSQVSPYWLIGHGGTIDIPDDVTNPWFYIDPTFDGSLTMDVTPLVDGTFTVYDSDFDEIQVDDDGELGVILSAGVPTYILFETTPAALEISWTYAQRASSQITVTLERDRITNTPGAVSVNIGNGNPDDAITFSVFGPTTVEDFATAKFSRDGDLVDYPIRLPALDAGDYLLRVETANTGTEEVPFTVLEDGMTWGGTTDEDPVPPVVDVQRWTFYDLRDPDDNWTLQRNPSSWSNMLPPNDFTHASTVAVDGQVLTWQAGARPWRMSFQGFIDNEDEYNRFVRWCDLRRRIWLIDHRNRPWLVTLEHFDANHVIKANLPWAHEYTVDAVIFKQGWS